MTVAPDDMLAAAAICRPTLDAIVGEDWSTQVRDLEWDVRRVLAHAGDAIGWYAAELAATGTPRLSVDFRVHVRASPSEVLDVLDAAACTLAHVARAVPSGTRAYHPAGVADASGSLAMGCDELLVHCWDVVTTFGGTFAAPADLSERVTRRLFPWVTDATDWWCSLLWANGRVDLPGTAERLGPDWAWHCAPLDEWDGTIPRWGG